MYHIQAALLPNFMINQWSTIHRPFLWTRDPRYLIISNSLYLPTSSAELLWWRTQFGVSLDLLPKSDKPGWTGFAHLSSWRVHWKHTAAMVLRDTIFAGHLSFKKRLKSHKGECKLRKRVQLHLATTNSKRRFVKCLNSNLCGVASSHFHRRKATSMVLNLSGNGLFTSLVTIKVMEVCKEPETAPMVSWRSLRIRTCIYLEKVIE